MKTLLYFFNLFLLFSLSACKKDWLDAKPDKKLVVPNTLPDLQAMLDNEIFVFNQNQPVLGEIGSDDYYILYPDWQALYTNTERNAYIWAKEIYTGESVSDWMNPYQRIFYENYILETLGNIVSDSTNITSWNNIKGSALFDRGFDFFSLADLFEKPYDSTTAETDPGIVLRLKSDINQKSVRATVAETFRQTISDLQNSLKFLPDLPAYKTRPSKASAFACLARVYLDLGNYATALKYADSSLFLQSNLIDYNTIDPTAQFPFPMFNDEVVYHTELYFFEILGESTAIVDSTLYNSYDNNDLRKYVFIDTTNGLPRFKGGYDGYTYFGGIATDEVFLMSAECNARLGNTTEAIERLNSLLVNRWKTGTFIPIVAANAYEALKFVLEERRKELLFRGLRWSDLRRLNEDTRFATTLTRILNGQTYTLAPNDERYVYPIPEQEINTSGIPQNPR